MADKQWPPEPWAIDDSEIVDSKDAHIVSGGAFEQCSCEIEKPTAARIIACVNACAGVPMEVLEHPSFHGMCKIVCEIAMVGKAAREAKEATDGTN